MLQVQVRNIVVDNACSSRGTRCDHNLIDVLDMRYFNLLFSVLAGRTSSSHVLWHVRAITTTATAHQRCIVPKLEALVCLA